MRAATGVYALVGGRNRAFVLESCHRKTKIDAAKEEPAMMNLLNRTAVALLKVIEVETQEATKEQADAWLRRVLLLEKFYRYTNILFRILIPVAIVAALYLLWRIARNLEKPPKLTEEVKIVRKSLSEMLKENRTRCKMTQEFVAESIGVSRQAVSKWENGVSHS